MKNRYKLLMKKGQAMMVATVFFLGLSTVIIFGLINPVVKQQKQSAQLFSSRQSYFLAESGVEDVIYKLTHSKPVGASGTMSLNGYTASIIISDDSGGKKIVSTGDVKTLIRKVQANLNLGTTISFQYGVQAGNGSFSLSNNAGVKGNIYSNYRVVGSNGAFVTGSVTAVDSISNIVVGTGAVGDVMAPTVTNTTAAGNLFCKTGTGNNKACNTAFFKPTEQNFAIPEEEITKWKNEAANGGIFVGNKVITGLGNVLGPEKIQGDLTIDIGGDLKLDGTLWVTGNVLLSNNSSLKLTSAYGSFSGVLVVDGTVTLSNGSDLGGTGEAGSNLMIISTNTSTSAISLSNNSGAVILYAPNGTITIANNANVAQMTAQSIALSNGAVIDYNKNIGNITFYSSETKNFEIIDWKEVE